MLVEHVAVAQGLFTAKPIRTAGGTFSELAWGRTGERSLMLCVLFSVVLSLLSICFRLSVGCASPFVCVFCFFLGPFLCCLLFCLRKFQHSILNGFTGFCDDPFFVAINSKGQVFSWGAGEQVASLSLCADKNVLAR